MTIQRYYSEGRLVADKRGGLVNYADHIEEIQRQGAAVKPPVIHVVTPESSSGTLWAEVQRLLAVEAESARTIAHLNQTHREVSEMQQKRIEELENAKVTHRWGLSLIFAHLTHAEYQRFMDAKVGYSGATGMAAHGTLAPYIATGTFALLDGIAALGWKHFSAHVSDTQWVLHKAREPEAMTAETAQIAKLEEALAKIADHRTQLPWSECRRIARAAISPANLQESDTQKALIAELEKALAQIGDCREHPQCIHARLARAIISKSAGTKPEAL